MTLTVPPETEQEKIFNYVKTESERIEKAIHLHFIQISQLKDYKTTLINSAVTGKIKVA